MGALFIGQNKIFLPEAESTNSYAMAMLKNVNPSEGTVVYTNFQNQGRGRRGNSWEASQGLNITASFILKPGFLDIKNIFNLYIISSLAVHDVLTHYLNTGQFDIKIKWPNDLMVNGIKIAGILNENVIKDNRIVYSVIGIGLNVNQIDFQSKATSLSQLLGQNYSLEEVLNLLSIFLEKHYLNLKNETVFKRNTSSELITEYYNKLFKLNEKCKLKTNNHIEQYLIKGINSSGLLLTENMKGELKAFDLNQVSWED